MTNGRPRLCLPLPPPPTFQRLKFEQIEKWRAVMESWISKKLSYHMHISYNFCILISFTHVCLCGVDAEVRPAVHHGRLALQKLRTEIT